MQHLCISHALLGKLIIMHQCHICSIDCYFISKIIKLSLNWNILVIIACMLSIAIEWNWGLRILHVMYGIFNRCQCYNVATMVSFFQAKGIHRGLCNLNAWGWKRDDFRLCRDAEWFWPCDALNTRGGDERPLQTWTLTCFSLV